MYTESAPPPNRRPGYSPANARRTPAKCESAAPWTPDGRPLPGLRTDGGAILPTMRPGYDRRVGMPFPRGLCGAAYARWWRRTPSRIIGAAVGKSAPAAFAARLVAAATEPVPRFDNS